MNKEIREKAEKIKMVILDVDGVMTDGSIILDDRGNELKMFHVRDGHGIKLLNKAGIKVAIITGRTSRVVERRADELGISDLYQGVLKKSSVYDSLLKKYNFRDEEIAYMGDDIVDIELLKRVGLPAAPSDSDEGIKQCADFVSTKKGGRGAVRELVEFILKSAGLWENVFGESID